MVWRPRSGVLVEVVAWIIVGLGPLSYLLWWGSLGTVEPLSVPISLDAGQFTSPYYTPAPDESYQVEIYFLPFNRTPLDLDWKIVDDGGEVIASGDYTDQVTGGNDAILGHYVPGRRSRQRIVVTIHQGDNVPNTDPRLHIGLPERGLAVGYGFAFVVGWAILVAFVGVIRVFVASRAKLRTREASSAGR